MNKPRDKKELVEELTDYFNNLSVDQLYILPKQNSTKNYLANVAAIFKNLDESDYQEFISLSKKIQPDIEREERKRAAHDIDIFMRRKVAEWKRYNFDNSNKDDADNKTGLMNIAGDYVGGDKIGRDQNISLSSERFFEDIPVWLKWLVAVVAILGFMWAIFTYFNPNINEEMKTVPDEQKSTVATSTPSLSDIFQKNNSLSTSLEKQNFIENYKDSSVNGSGTFIDIRKSGNNYIVEMTIERNVIGCQFDNSFEQSLLLLSKGDIVNFSGIFTGGGLTFGSAGVNPWYITDCILR